VNEDVGKILAKDGFTSEREALDTMVTSNPLIRNGGRPTHVVIPQNAGDVANLVKTAFQNGIPLVPVSSSAPHYKGGIACSSDHICVDLSGSKKIRSVDRRNRVCMIEPGVTYGELLDALEPHGLTVPIPLAPRSGKSVVASVMDREPSTWPGKQWDAGDPVCSTEFVFGGGQFFRTGAAGGPGSIEQQRAAGGAQKGPTGPSQTDFHRVLQGAQGTMGIVTWITVRAELKPSVQEPRVIGVDDLNELIPFVYKVQRPLLGEHSFILNRMATAMLMSYSDTDSFDEIHDSLPAFICLQNIAGFERLARKRLEYQLKDIEEIAADTAVDPAKSVGNVTASELLKTATNPCGETDWRNALSGHCLRVFFLTTLDRAPKFIGIMEGVMRKQDASMDRVGIYIQPVVQNHGCHMEFMIPFDPGDDGYVMKMLAIETAAVDALAEGGAFFSRPYGAAEKVAFKRNRLNFDILKKIKELFDPGHILNPGKFGL